MEIPSDPTKILEKGPEYLRKQMELESETKGHMSAVQRLAASKPKYVKSQQVVNTTQEPIISLGSASVSSTGSSNWSSTYGGNSPMGSNSTEATVGSPVCSPRQVRPSSFKKRPDSLLLYRQKCELLRGAANDRKHHITRKVLLNSVKKNALLLETAGEEFEPDGMKKKNTRPEGTAKVCSPHAAHSEKRRNGIAEHRTESGNSGKMVATALLSVPVPEFQRRSGKRVSRSHSDISSRYSKNFADFDAFFKYCGLDGEVIESLGKENFSARSDEIAINIRSISVSTSDDGFSRSSDNSDGLMEDKLHEKIRQKTSVIERNARIIKWLYSCKNAKDSGKKLRDLD